MSIFARGDFLGAGDGWREHARGRGGGGEGGRRIGEVRIVCTLTTANITTGSLGAVSKVIFVNILPQKIIRRLDK